MRGFSGRPTEGRPLSRLPRESAENLHRACTGKPQLPGLLGLMWHARRFCWSFLALALIVLGLGSRRPGMPEFVILYLGDVQWGAFFFVLYAIALPRAAPRRLWGCAVGTTELIEFSQLYRPPWLERIRATPLGGLLLGHAFLWSDVLCVALGATAAALLALVVGHALRRRRLGRRVRGA